jgi:hypothetical protein
MCDAEPRVILRRVVPRCAGVTAMLAALGGCASGTLGDTAGVQVEGQASSVLVSWDASHPWAAQFQGQATRFRLYAQYRSAGQPLEQDLGPPRPSGTGGWIFELPPSMKAVPESPICLFVSASRTSPSIPVRSRARPGADTARFRFPAWEAKVSGTTRAALGERELAQLTRSVADLEAELERQREPLLKAGVRSPEDCQRLSAGAAPASAEVIPADVLAPAQQADGTQRVCVRRARNMRRSPPAYRVDVAEFLSRWMAETPAGANDRARLQAAQFQQHWSRWYERTGVDYTPEVGDPGDRLPTGGVLDEAIVGWNKAGGSGSAEARRGIAAGLLDSYAGCLEDVAKQLKVKHDSWQKAQVNRPLRDRLYAERQQAACVARVNDIGRLNEALNEARSRADAKRGDAPSAPSGAPPAPAGKVSLNSQDCTI